MRGLDVCRCGSGLGGGWGGVKRCGWRSCLTTALKSNNKEIIKREKNTKKNKQNKCSFEVPNSSTTPHSFCPRPFTVSTKVLHHLRTKLHPGVDTFPFSMSWRSSLWSFPLVPMSSVGIINVTQRCMAALTQPLVVASSFRKSIKYYNPTKCEKKHVGQVEPFDWAMRRRPVSR